MVMSSQSPMPPDPPVSSNMMESSGHQEISHQVLSSEPSSSLVSAHKTLPSNVILPKHISVVATPGSYNLNNTEETESDEDMPVTKPKGNILLDSNFIYYFILFRSS
jgi:hypothetical protein